MKVTQKLEITQELEVTRRRLYQNYNQLQEDESLVDPDNEVGVYFFGYDSDGRAVFEVRDELGGSSMDLVDEDGKSVLLPKTYFDTLREKLRWWYWTSRYTAPVRRFILNRTADISMEDVLGPGRTKS